MERGTGITTKQMQAAPQGAVFVWFNRHTHYPKALALKLGRDDLDIRPLAWLSITPRNWTATDTRH